MFTIYPCGYSIHSDHIAALMHTDPSLLLIDLRATPSSPLAAWRRPYLVEAYGDRYGWLGETLGNAHYKTGGPILLKNPDSGIAHLLELLEQGYNLLLLCGCARYETCHRHEVVALLKQAMPTLTVIFPDQLATPGNKKALSIRQPWPWLILHAGELAACHIPPKNIENRDYDVS